MRQFGTTAALTTFAVLSVLTTTLIVALAPHDFIAVLDEFEFWFTIVTP